MSLRAGHQARRGFFRGLRGGLAAAALCLAVGAACAAEDLAGPLAEAQAALAAGDYARAYPLYLEQAESKGNPLAQFSVGLFHQLGWGRPADPKAACGWFERSAAGNIPAAEHFAGDCLRKGIHREADAPAAALLYERAASHGHLISLCSLGEMYVAGEGVPRDPAKGIALCRQAAEKGLKPAQVRLARFYLDGAGGSPDYPAAVQWMTFAAEADYPEAQHLLAGLYRDGRAVKADPVKALFWSEHAAANGYVPAYLPTAQAYLATEPDPQTGLIPPEALAKAYLWLSALDRRATDPDQRAEASRLLEQVKSTMPESWRPDLDRKVDEHLARYAGPPAGPVKGR